MTQPAPEGKKTYGERGERTFEAWPYLARTHFFFWKKKYLTNSRETSGDSRGEGWRYFAHAHIIIESSPVLNSLRLRACSCSSSAVSICTLVLATQVK